MRSNQPPRIATWFLRHFGCSVQNQAVIGDLLEKYQQGHSRSWYWWQVAIAIAEGFITELRLRKLLVARALLIGMALQLLYSYSIHSILHQIPYQWVWQHPNVIPRIGIWIATIACAFNGRILAWLHRSHPRTVVFAFLALQFITMFVPINTVRYQLSWVFQVGGSINAIVWNSHGMTALDRSCTVCTNFSAFGGLLSIMSVSMTVFILLVGSVVLRDSTNTSGETYDISTTT